MNNCSLFEKHLVAGNLDGETRVFVFLELHNHQEQENWISQALEQLKPTSSDIGLKEYSERQIPDSLSKFPIKWEKWGNKEFIEKCLQNMKKIHSWEKAIQNLLTTQSTEILDRVQKIQELNSDAALLNEKVDIENLETWLGSPVAYQDKLTEIKSKLLETTEKVRKVFIQQQVHSGFAPSQTSLIQHIEKSLENYRHVFVICGKNHGHPTASQFPDEAQRLINFLKKTSPYAILDASEKS